MEDKVFSVFLKVCVGIIYASVAGGVATWCFATGRKALREGAE